MHSQARSRAVRPGWGRLALRTILGVYLRTYHHLRFEGAEHLPPHGPAFVVLNHASLLDVPALMVVDPYPNTVTVVKASLARVPVVNWALAQWGAIPVERQGRDSTGVRQLLGALRAGGVVAVAAEGRRTRRGRLEAINPVLAKIVASSNVPIVPVGVSGTFEALPPGAFLPRPRPITIRVGPSFRLPRGTDGPTAAREIRARIAALLPPSMQPVDDDSPGVAAVERAD